MNSESNNDSDPDRLAFNLVDKIDLNKSKTHCLIKY